MAPSRSLYAPMSSERPFPWGGRRGENLSSLRHISSTIASALADAKQPTSTVTTIVLHGGPLAQQSIYNIQSDPLAWLLPGYNNT